jgi:hypothetical protein
VSCCHRRGPGSHYKKDQGDEEWDLLPQYIQTVIAQFCLVRSFLSWNKTTNKIGGTKPYTKQKIAKSWAEMKGKVPPPKKNQEETSAKKALKGYKIPKKSQDKENETEGTSLTKKGPREADQALRGEPGLSWPPQEEKREQVLRGKKKMEEGYKISPSSIRSQRSYKLENAVSSPVTSTSRNVIPAASPDSEVPPEAIENVRDFFNQILIKNITHIDAKINEIRLLTNVNLNEIQQISKIVSNNLGNKINEIHHINGNVSDDTSKLLQFTRETMDAKLNELNHVNIQNHQELRQIAKMVLENTNDLAKIIPGNKHLREMVKLLKEIKSLVAIQEEPAADISGHIIQEMKSILENRPAAAPNSNSQDDAIIGELNKLKVEMENKLSSTKAALKKEIRDQVDQLHEDNDNSSVHQEVQVDNILAILEKVEKMEKEMKNHMNFMESTLNTRFVKLETNVLIQMGSLEATIKEHLNQWGPDVTSEHSGSSRSSGNPRNPQMEAPATPVTNHTEAHAFNNAQNSGKLEVPKTKDWPKFKGEGEP